MRQTLTIFVALLFTATYTHAANIEAVLDSVDGSSEFVIQDSGTNQMFGVNSDGDVTTLGYVFVDSDSKKFYVGDDQDLEIYHAGGSGSFIKNATATAGALTIQNDDQDQDLIFGIDDGGVDKTITWDADVDKILHSAGTFDFDNDNLTTTGTGAFGDVEINPANGVAGLTITGGTTDSIDLFKMIANGHTQRLILERSAGATTFLEAASTIGLFGTSSNHDFHIRTNYADRMVFENDGSKITIKTPLDLETNNLTTAGDIRVVSDSTKIEVGALAGGDLEIYHDGTNSVIDNNTADLNVISADDINMNSGFTVNVSGDVIFKTYTDATRPAAGTAGRVIFNSDDGNLNIDDGTNWINPHGVDT